MVDDDEYMKSLEEGYNKLPEELYGGGRFKIPQVKGKLIKTKTVITNFRDIAKTFSRDENFMLKFFLKEAGVRGEINPRGELILHSRFQPTILNKIVKKFFERYVECPHCRSPDTDLDMSNNSLTCKACGFTGKV
jgi:putative translation initiation factor aIF-2 beta subunit